MSALDMFPEAHRPKPNDLDLRYTTRDTLDLCKKLAGINAFDLDVAADAESHHADNWYGIELDGLRQRWFGRVWCNPPYSDIEPWVRRAWKAYEADETEVIAMLLPCNRTEQSWWQQMVEPYRDLGVLDGSRSLRGTDDQPVVLFGDVSLTTHFLPGRIKFGHPGNRDAVGVGSPKFGCVLLVWRRA